MPGAALVPKRWKDVFGAEPDEVIRQPSMPSVEGGSKSGARWQITHQPGRVDLVIAPENPTSPPTDPLNIGEFEAMLDPLLSAAEKIFDPTAAIQRLAIGTILFMPVDTIRDGLRTIQMVVPQIQRIPENSTDLLFQINVPIVMNDPLPELLVNRLAKWQVVGIQLFNVLAGPAMSFQLTTTAVRPVVRLELDINTSPERAVAFPPDKIAVLLRQLGGITRRLAKSGGFQ
jgi:hypothetical protein